MPEGFKGHVILRMPTYAERLGLYDSGEMLEETPAEDSKEKSEARTMKRSKALMRHVAERLGEFVVEVDILREKDGFRFQSFDQMNYDTDMIAVLTEIAGKVIGRNEVGSPS